MTRNRRPTAATLWKRKEDPVDADKFKADLLQVRVALERTKQVACASSQEAIHLREEIQELAAERDRLKSELNRSKGHEKSLYQTITSQTKQIEQYQDRNAKLRAKVKQITDSQRQTTAAPQELRHQTSIVQQHIAAMRRLAMHAQRHFASTTPAETATGLHLVDAISTALDAFESQMGSSSTESHQETPPPPAATAASRPVATTPGLIAQYRMAIVKSNAQVRSLETQLALEQELTRKMQKEVVFYKAKAMGEGSGDSHTPPPLLLQDDDEDERASEIAQLQTLCSEYDKTNQQLREKMVHQARVIEKLQQNLLNKPPTAAVKEETAQDDQ